MEDRKREVSGKHVLKLSLLIRTLALKGPSSKYDLSKYDHSRGKKPVKFSWPLVHKLLRELIKDGRVQQYGEVKAKKHKTTLYGLSFLGLLCFFQIYHQNASVDQKEKAKAIENYSEVHPIFKYWEKLEKSFKSQNMLYAVLRYASSVTLGLERGSVTFEPLYPIQRIGEIARGETGERIVPFFIEDTKEAFTMNFFMCLSGFHDQMNELSIPEIYEYSKTILDKKLNQFESIKNLILKFK